MNLKVKKEYERVKEEFEVVARLGGQADIKSAMIVVDNLLNAIANSTCTHSMSYIKEYRCVKCGWVDSTYSASA